MPKSNPPMLVQVDDKEHVASAAETAQIEAIRAGTPQPENPQDQ